MKPTIKERFEWLVRSRQFCIKERRENVEKLASLRATLGDDDFFSHTVLVDSSFEVVGKLENEDSEIPADIKETFKNINTITVKIYNLVKNFYTNCRQQDRARLTVNTKQQQRVMKSAALFKCRTCSNMLQLWERDGMVQPNGEVKAKRCFRCVERRRESERLKRDQVREEGIWCSRHINIPFQLVDNGRRRACLRCGNDRLNGCQKSLETCACTVQRMDSVQCTRCKIDLSGMVSIGGSIHHLIFGCPEAKKTFRNTRSFHSCQVHKGSFYFRHEEPVVVLCRGCHYIIHTKALLKKQVNASNSRKAHKECVNKLGGKCLVCH
ncbi:hypothetical protein C9374_013722 [Naegleria lovaniensis]|uniref:Uncharacterized protein n=1 Tax=Naegleria lovaniensis TaxID=51637 RepID=A0AA88G9C0_NAELO|nr:uncharacterized protein C9374_013722 [Naegleria lovaniensis]KAG2370922.1 hypothetical protein C9374_013722 [Naegleria lovaniensis]